MRNKNTPPEEPMVWDSFNANHKICWNKMRSSFWIAEVVHTKEEWSGGDLFWSVGDPLQIHTKEYQWSRLAGIIIEKLGAGNKNNGAIFAGEKKELQITDGKEGLPRTTAEQATPQPEVSWSLPALVMIEVDTKANSGTGHETRYQPAIVTPKYLPREPPPSPLQWSTGKEREKCKRRGRRRSRMWIR